MTPEQWHRVKDALSLAMKQPANERTAALNLACAGDAALRSEVADLLDHHDEMGSFLDRPLFGEGDPDPEPDRTVPHQLQQWTHYQVIEYLGSGGMAVVYKAWDPRLRRAVAIKVISERDERTVTRFLREAEAQARVDHPNVLKVFETGVVGAHHYIAMQLVDGPTLIGVRDETTLDAKVDLMRQIAEGLHAAHRIGLIHRDIKPANILVERSADGLKPYLHDFGLAVDVDAPGLTQTGAIVGTPRYMAPERIQGGAAALDRRSDIYSVGATFYEFLTGAAPFAGSSGLQVLVDVLEQEITPLLRVLPTLSPELDAIVGKCMEKDAHERYASARALADDLQRYLNGDAVQARPIGRLARVVRKARKYPGLAVAFVSLAVTILASVGWGAYQSWRITRQTQLAEQLGEEMQNIEWLYRAAQMSPLHAIGDQKRQIRERMRRIEEMLDSVGSLATGPGHYALGRGFQTLGDQTRTLEHLQHGWDSGYRTPDAAMALGLVHGEIFRNELAKAQRIDSDRDRAARIGAVQHAHGDPALSFLSAGRASAIVPARYVEALLAAHRNDIQEAIRTSADAIRETPWLFEAHLLAGHVRFTEAVRLYLRGNAAGASTQADEADRHYADAERVAASSIDAYVGRCAVAGLVLHMIEHRLERDAEPSARQAEESCSRAMVVDPDAAEAHRYFGEAIMTWGNINVITRSDPGDAYDRAAGMLTSAVRLSGGAVEARLAFADLWMNRAWWESRTGQDPRAAIERAIAEYTGVLTADARNMTAFTNIGQTLILRYRYEVGQGLDPLASQDRAIEVFKATLRVEPSLAFGFTNLARTAIARADTQALRRVDPARGLDDVIRFIEGLPANALTAARETAVRQLRARLDSR